MIIAVDIFKVSTSTLSISPLLKSHRLEICQIFKIKPMLKFFRQFRQQLLRQGSFQKYLLYAIGEILLVVIGILIALQINNWNNKRIEKDAELQIYQAIKRQITEDKSVIDKTIAYNNNYLKQFKYAVQLIEGNNRSEADTLAMIALKLSKYSNFDRKSNIYESLVNSGEINVLHNDYILDELQRLEETYLYFNRMEDIHYDIVMNVVPELTTAIKYTNQQIIKFDRIYSYEFQNVFITSIQVMEEKDAVYHRAINQIKKIQELIEEELKIQK